MVTKATVSYTNDNKYQDCITGDIVKESQNTLTIHPENKTKVSSLKFDTEKMRGCILQTNNTNILDIDVIDYNPWTFNNELYFLLPNKFTENSNEIHISGIYNSVKSISKDKITIETDDTLFKLLYNSKSNDWTLDKDYVIESKDYRYDIVNKNSLGSNIFHLATDIHNIRSLGVNSERIG